MSWIDKSDGLKVEQLDPNNYIIYNGSFTVHCDLFSLKSNLTRIGVNKNDVSFALKSLQDNKHNIAIFGLNKCFLYSEAE